MFLRWLASCRPSLPRSATNKGWPPWPTCPQAAQGDARQGVAVRTPVSEKHGRHWLANLANFPASNAPVYRLPSTAYRLLPLGPLGSLGCLKRRPRRAASPFRLPWRTRYFNMPGGESIRGISAEFGRISKTVHRPSPWNKNRSNSEVVRKRGLAPGCCALDFNSPQDVGGVSPFPDSHSDGLETSILRSPERHPRAPNVFRTRVTPKSLQSAGRR
jgi:hypothetical protein